ncbi:hypothetical protein [Sphaerotilus sp.]|uniref:hypothetical protein n=1 Tax=Sphaerotilus sp. TaxID=2093942 RepID=UPI002ACE7C7D|nr:hypothetical protein [Sphaerotilus sp.]MDZ7855592.1 hypothetical protein [Sphaerotilus sp.]
MSDFRSAPFLRSLLGAAVGLGLMAANTAGIAQTASTICEPDGGYVVAYYNGTFATPEDADAQRAALRIARHGKYTGAAETATTAAGKAEPVRYETFYSTAGTASGATESRFQALAGEYRKLLDGALTQNWEYFWDMASGNTDAWSVLAAKSADARFLAVTSSFPGTVNSLSAKVRTELTAQLADGNNTTLAARQLARAQALYTERQKLLMVAYSQGELFANKAFTKLGAPTDNTVRKEVLATAPASALGTSLTTTMAALTIPNPTSNQGFITATLSWSVPATAIGKLADGTDIQNDLDLHVIEPTGTHVYYGLAERNKGGGQTTAARQGDAGYLDADSTTVGPEHYYASCDENVLKEGVYKISVAQESVSNPALTNLTLQVAFAKSGEVFSKTWNARQSQNPSTSCVGCTGEVPGFTQASALKTHVKVQVTKLGPGNWTAALVD